jgi:tellurite resistance protein TehA-like permease
MPWTEWLETTAIALTVRDSQLLTGGLSAVHLLGFTLTMGGALVGNLTMMGALFRGRPLVDVARPTSRGIAAGLGLSVVTGALLFAPRATAASGSAIFQAKMLLLLGAASFHFAVHYPMARRARHAWALRVTGAAGLALWAGLALAGCAFILLE